MRVTVQLLGGPFDGFTDQVALPLQQIVTVAYCRGCRGRHLAAVTGMTAADRPLYLRAPERDHDGILAYCYVDVDDTLRHIHALEPEGVPIY